MRLATMGTIALLDEAGTPAAGPRRKDVLLLVFLRMESGRPHPRGTLASLLWGETVERNARHSLTQALGRLQRALPPGVLQASGDLVECSPALPCDAAELQEALARGDASRAAELHAGDFLPGVALGEDGREFERWAMLRRDELRTSLLALLERAADTAAADGDWRRVLELAGRAVAADPFAEAGHRHVIRAHAELGERTRALQQYERLKTLLDREFGDVPSDESAALVAAIRAAAPGETPPPAAPPATETPAPAEPAAPPPPPQAAASSAAPAPHARHAPRRWALASGAAVAALGLVAVLLWGAREEGAERVAAHREPAAAAPDAPPCAPGAARARVVEEVFHYGVRVAPGRPFEKMWVVQNTGDCTWSTDFHLQYLDSDPQRLSVTIMGISLEHPVRPGETYPVAVRMQAPPEPGTYREAWQLRDGADRPVPVGDADRLVAGIVVPQPSYPLCAPGEGRAALLATRYPEMPVKRPGEAFRYSWTVRNVGECTWSAEARLRRVESRARISRDSVVGTTHAVEPRQTYTFLVTSAAPAEPGVHRETWRVEDRGAVVPVDGAEETAVTVRVLPPGTPATGPRLCLPAEARMRFLDENVPDSSAFRPGARFTKRWTLVNSGPCAWRPDFRIRYRAHTGALLSLSQEDLTLDEVVHPGATYTVEIPMRAPRRPGFYREDWSVFDHEGTVLRMGTAPYIAALIVVDEG